VKIIIINLIIIKTKLIVVANLTTTKNIKKIIKTFKFSYYNKGKNNCKLNIKLKIKIIAKKRREKLATKPF